MCCLMLGCALSVVWCLLCVVSVFVQRLLFCVWCLSFVGYLLVVVCCLLIVVCCSLRVPRWALPVDCCWLVAVRCLLLVECCVSLAWSVVCCVLFAGCWLLVVGLLVVGRSSLSGACCALFGLCLVFC